ncbi:MAG: clan AA aspartic protease [Candidatus Omnitrophica bacterium]|nr:clan AA aspartic protease [Candidatus Omnitrophota bacterium]
MRYYFALVLLICSGCTFLEATGEAVGVVGKAGWTAGKAIGGAVYTGTSMAGQTANQANRTISRPADKPDKKAHATLSSGRTVIPLIKEGKSYFVRVKLNDKLWGKFMLDTGASALQISGAMAKKLRVRVERGEAIPVILAGGAQVAGRVVVLDKVQLGDAAVDNVRAVVLDGDRMGLRDGLLGMSFLENFVFKIDTKREELILEQR